jgi:hypothetical protein
MTSWWPVTAAHANVINFVGAFVVPRTSIVHLEIANVIITHGSICTASRDRTNADRRSTEAVLMI